MLLVPPQLRIPDDELSFSFVRSSGPGGQNVNKVNTKAVLRWSVRASRSLPEDVRQRFLERHRQRITQAGEIIITSQRFRDQGRNQRDCLEKLHDLLTPVVLPPKRRKKTRPTKASVARRQIQKRQHSHKKQRRRLPSDE